MNSMRSVLLMIFATGLACAPAPPPEEPIDLGAEKASLLEADQKWADAFAAAENKADVFVAQFEEGARILPPDAPLASGKEAIHEVIEHLMSMPGMETTWKPTMADVSGEADMGFTIGTYKMKFEGPDGNPVEIDGKYMTVWKKQADGSWKVTSDMFNADAPMAAPE